MVTRIITRRIISSTATAAKDSNQDDVNQLKDNKQRSDDDDDKYDSKEASNEGGAQKLCSFKSCQNKAAADRGVFDGHLVFNDDTTDDGKQVDMQQRDCSTTATRKRPLLSDDAVGRRQRQKFIDLSDVPPKLPIKSSRKNGSSKYVGVTFYKAMKKWAAKIIIDGKVRFIGYYDNEETAAIDYARAKFKYKEDHLHLPSSIPKEMEERHRKAIADAIKSVQQSKYEGNRKSNRPHQQKQKQGSLLF